MSSRIPDVGDQDPTQRNSPIAGEEDEETPFQDMPGVVCWFNDVAYEHGTFVKSGTVVLRCDRGIWIESGSADAENP